MTKRRAATISERVSDKRRLRVARMHGFAFRSFVVGDDGDIRCRYARPGGRQAESSQSIGYLVAGWAGMRPGVFERCRPSTPNLSQDNLP